MSKQALMYGITWLIIAFFFMTAAEIAFAQSVPANPVEVQSWFDLVLTPRNSALIFGIFMGFVGTYLLQRWGKLPIPETENVRKLDTKLEKYRNENSLLKQRVAGMEATEKALTKAQATFDIKLEKMENRIKLEKMENRYRD